LGCVLKTDLNYPLSPSGPEVVPLARVRLTFTRILHSSYFVGLERNDNALNHCMAIATKDIHFSVERDKKRAYNQLTESLLVARQPQIPAPIHVATSLNHPTSIDTQR
jgi:hypothetical protein